ncbi:hypothetical protein [Blastomonas sp.]|uniref:hypothetical protein n=1 Tax=Blastomonas sp. TaxID=1909299 RepID=UPI003593F49E
MSDDSATDKIKPDERDPELLLYDFLKYLATLALLILGAVLSLTGTDSALPARNLAIVIIVMATAALVAIVAADRVVVLRLQDKPIDRTVRWSRSACMWLLTFGTGLFLSNWVSIFV